MRYPSHVCRLLSLYLVLSAPSAWANIAEHFDTDAAGWSVVDIAGSAYISLGAAVPMQYLATGGNPGGYIQASDPSNDSFFFQSSTAFLGNLSAYAGGTLGFDAYYTPQQNEWNGDPDVILSNGTTTLFYKGATHPGADWTHVDITLASGAGWTVGSFGAGAANAADFTDVLSSVSVFRIRGEYVAGVIETTGLDNVVLSAVPEPEAWAMLIGGLGVLGLRLRRR